MSNKGRKRRNRQAWLRRARRDALAAMDLGPVRIRHGYEPLDGSALDPLQIPLIERIAAPGVAVLFRHKHGIPVALPPGRLPR